MRTTLDIDDDVLLAAKELARRERKTAGRVLSELARCGLAHANDTYLKEITDDDEVFFGFRPFACRGAVVTNEIINRLREEDAD
jgi:hypothetical protein